MSATHDAVVQMWPRGLSARGPRLGFLGLGWIGRARMQSLMEARIAQVVAVADSDPGLLREATPSGCRHACGSLEALLQHRLDGVVIATPSALHAAQASLALEHGCSVFCQKPLARTAAEAARVVATARARDRLLGVDFSYRFVEGIAAVREQILRGELGDLYAVDLTFHNAYGPDKEWFYDVARSGGGCVMDLGVHLIDLALWMTGSARALDLDARLYRQGSRLHPPLGETEDYASVQCRLDGGACMRMTCSWRLPAGADAVIEASFYGTRGGASMRNVAGSFYDFTIDRHEGTRCWRLASPPDAWGGRALVAWARQLSMGGRFDEDAHHFVDIAAVVDGIYGR